MGNISKSTISSHHDKLNISEAFFTRSHSIWDMQKP